MIATAIIFAELVIRVPLLIPLNYNEGWNAYFAAKLAAGAPLYPESSSLITNNYPPAYFYLLWLLGSVFGDYIIVGRVVAFISLLLVALNIAVLVRVLNGSTAGGLYAAVLFLGMIGVYSREFVGTNEPQWLAHAVMTTALIVVLKSGDNHWLLAAGAALMCGGGLIKHNVLPIPIAVTVWLFVYERSKCRRWIAYGVCGMLAISIYVYVTFGPIFFTAVFGHARQYALGLIARATAIRFLPYVPLIGAAALYFVIGAKDNPRVAFAAIWAVSAAIWSLFIQGGAGVSLNALFDLVIALSVTAGMLIDFVATMPLPDRQRTTVKVLAMTCIALPLLLRTPLVLMGLLKLSPRLSTQQAETAGAIELLRSRDGKAVCENLALCYWAGKDFEVDVFNAGQRIFTGAISETQITKHIAARDFSVIQLDEAEGTDRMPPTVNQRIFEFYETVKSTDRLGVFLVPRVEWLERSVVR